MVSQKQIQPTARVGVKVWIYKGESSSDERKLRKGAINNVNAEES